MNIKKKEGYFMKKTKIAATLLVSAMLLAGCGIKGSQAIIKINDHVITQKEFDKIMDQQITQSPFAKLSGADNVKADKDGFIYLMTAQRVINQMIVEEILDQEAEARGITVSKEELDQEIIDTMDKIGGKNMLMEALKQNGISTSEFKASLKKQVKYRKLAATTGSMEASEKEAKDFYNKNISKFKHGEQVRASHILISFDPEQVKAEISSDPKKELSEKEVKAEVDKVMAEKKALADKIANELKADTSKFAEYATKYSQDPGSVAQGGDLGFFEKGKMVPEFDKAVFAAKPNTAPGVVKTQFGYHVYIVTDRMAAGAVPFEKAKADIEAYLKNQKEVKALDDITQAAKKKSTIEYVDEKYNPDVINDKLHNQVNDLTGGAKDEYDKSQKDKKAPAKK